MFVVVFLCGAKKHIIVPQTFISGLSQQSLNNDGKNRNRKYLVFWSESAICNEIPNLNYTPNFESNISDIFPPVGRNEACYFAHIKYFFGKYQENQQNSFHLFVQPINHFNYLSDSTF